MIRFLVLVLLSFTTVAFCSDSDVFDLQYLPGSGTTFGVTDFTYLTGKASGDKLNKKLSGQVFTHKLGYASSHRLSLMVDMNYANFKSQMDHSSALNAFGERDFEQVSKGISDPSFSFRYRFLDRAFRLDLTGRATISTGDQKIRKDEITNHSGGNTFEIGAELGKKNDDFQWAFLGVLRRAQQMTVDDKDNSENYEVDSFDTWIFQLSFLNKFFKRSFLRSVLSTEFQDRYENENNEEQSASKTTYKIQGEYQYLVSQNLLLRGGISYLTFNTAGFDKYYSWVTNLGATYQY